jgi:uncharacterized membrane protein YcfT
LWKDLTVRDALPTIDASSGQANASGPSAAPGPLAARPAAPTAPRSAAARTQWADAAKGTCILLVVLWHVVMKQYLQVDWRLSVPLPGAWGTLGEQLLPLRMPLFFTISGMFAVGAVSRPWRVLLKSKTAKFLYLYAVWLVIHTAILSRTPDFHTDRATNALEFLGQLTITPSNLWYLFALAVYFTITKTVRKLPAAPVLALALLLSAVAAAGVLDTPGNRGGLYQNLVFFLAGFYFRPYVERLAALANWRRLAVATGAYVAALLAMAVTGTQAYFGVWPLVSVVATIFGVTAAAMACRWRPLADRLAALGRQTLPIYVIHMPLVALFHIATVDALSGLNPKLQLGYALVGPIVVTALITWVCLLLHRALLRIRATWLFDLPSLPGRAKRAKHRAGQAE